MWYLILAVTGHMGEEVVPHYLSSDQCEQEFAFFRIGRFLVRKTNLDSLSIVQGSYNMNMSLSLDEGKHHLFEDDVAHTMGKSMIPVLWWEGDLPTTSIQSR